MKCFVIAAAVGSLLSGLIAAYYWYKSSKVSFGPNWTLEPVVEDLANMGRFAAIMNASSESSRLNKIAALWTAPSVILSAIVSVVGTLPWHF